MRDQLVATLKKYGPWLLACLAAFVLGHYLGTPIPLPPLPQGPPPAEQYSQGWVANPDAVKAVAEGLRFRSFGDTPAGKSEAADPDYVYLWDAFRKLYGTTPPAKNQGQVGSCVSFGTNSAIRRTMWVQIALLHANEEFRDIAEEVTYGGSRVQVGGGRLSGDGSVGAWAAKWVKDYGLVARDTYGSEDLREYSESRCRQYGSRGCPKALESVAREHPVKEITQIKSWAEAKKALAQGYGIAVCSGQGFSMQRDSRGVAAARGSWAHCMCLDGYHKEGSQEFGHIENSWGPSAHTGPVGWGNPSTAGFWADARVIERMIGEGDTWAFSSVVGFPAQRIDWFVDARPRARNPFTLTGGAACEPLFALAP